VPLKHELRNTCMGIPELNAAVLGTTEHPITMRSESNAEHEILVAFKSAHTLAGGTMCRHEAR
jgi:hypothetical protein